MPKKRTTNESGHSRIDEKLIENFVELQKVMTNMADRFDKLTHNISALLHLFEVAAVSFAEKHAKGEVEKDKEFLDKLNTLMEQNKTIAKGLTLMEEKMRQKLYGNSEQQRSEPPKIAPRPLPRI